MREQLLDVRARRGRRLALALVLCAAGAAMALAACGDDTPERAGTTAATDAFPVSISHARGTTVIPSQPKRVVTVGYSDHEAVLALGVRPVGIMNWFDEKPFGKWPWIKPLWGSAGPPPVISTPDGINIEKIAGLRPDLILGLYAGPEGITKSVYEKLSKLAPTVAYSPDSEAYTTPWQDMARTTGRALGREQQADKLIAGIEGRFAEIRKQHPEFAKETAVVVDANDGFYPFSSKDPRGQFMHEMGFRSDPALEKAIGKKFGLLLSGEQTSLLDVDRLVLLIDAKADKSLQDNKLYQRLRVVRDNHVVKLPYYDDPSPGAALAYNTLLSIPYGIDQLLPELVAQEKG